MIHRSRQPPELWTAPAGCGEGSESEWHGGRSVRRRGRFFRWQVSPRIVSLLFQLTKGEPGLPHSFGKVTQLAFNRFERQQMCTTENAKVFCYRQGGGRGWEPERKTGSVRGMWAHHHRGSCSRPPGSDHTPSLLLRWQQWERGDRRR